MLIIRRYEPQDNAAALSLHKIALQSVNAYLGDGPWNDDLQQIEKVYLSGDGEFLVGLIDSRLVAMGALRRTSEKKAEIKRMRVHPEYHRRGFGQAILTALEQRARELGYTTLHLDTATAMNAAQHLYIKNGYVEVSRVKGKKLDQIFYEKTLTTQP